MSTRMSGGEDGGRGHRSSGRSRVRPTSDRVRAAIFSIIGRDTVDRFLQLLDPEGKNDRLQRNRKVMNWLRASVNDVKIWIRNESLNMDMDFGLGFIKPMDRELLRRHALGDLLDQTLQPKLEPLALALGWNRVR